MMKRDENLLPAANDYWAGARAQIFDVKQANNFNEVLVWVQSWQNLDQMGECKKVRKAQYEPGTLGVEAERASRLQMCEYIILPSTKTCWKAVRVHTQMNAISKLVDSIVELYEVPSRP